MINLYLIFSLMPVFNKMSTNNSTQQARLGKVSIQSETNGMPVTTSVRRDIIGIRKNTEMQGEIEAAL